MLKTFFKGKRVFITGHTGFKGSWLSYWLYLLGAEVAGYALPTKYEQDHFNLLNLAKLIHHTEADIRDYSRLFTAMKDFEPDLVFHLAAQPLVGISYEQPRETFETNVLGSVNVLEAIRQIKTIKSLIFVTTDKCYKNKEWIWGYRENDELGGKDPYSSSKAAAELVFSSYLESYFHSEPHIGTASVRAGNVVGGGDWSKDRLIPDIVKALQNNETIIIRKPEAIRPWQHVLDPLYGYLLLSAKLYEDPRQYSGPWNFGPRSDSNRTVLEVVEKSVSIWGKGKIEILKKPPDYYEANLLQLNCDKANNFLKWHPLWNFDTSIINTIIWYKRYCEGDPPGRITKEQILSYMEALNHD